MKNIFALFSIANRGYTLEKMKGVILVGYVSYIVHSPQSPAENQHHGK